MEKKTSDESVVATQAETKEVAKKGLTIKKLPTKKAPAKKAAIKESMVIEFQDKSYSQADLVKIAKDVWKYDLKRKVSEFKEVELFVKPEEAVVYYIINQKESGSFYI